MSMPAMWPACCLASCSAFACWPVQGRSVRCWKAQYGPHWHCWTECWNNDRDREARVTSGSKLQAGAEFPVLTLPKANGGDLALGGRGRWQTIVIYRGKHCPLCRKYLKTLDNLLDSF